MHDFLSTEILRWVPVSTPPPREGSYRFLICLDYPGIGPYVVGARPFLDLETGWEWVTDTGDVMPFGYPLITHWAIVHGPDFTKEEDYDA